ncbi:MAG TPA: hypothetical protein VEJ20_08955 [Candidatus Eremiobacteraceae bacterium]|nr:hypothetical protein [Candidatus Eremiobacteraceae bacterium]
MYAFLLANVALGFYNMGTIWAHEVDIFPSWLLVGDHVHAVQLAHWRKLAYWIFAPFGAAFAGSVALFRYHPAGSPPWAIAGVFGCQFAAIGLTAILWARWQALLSRDPRGAGSPYLLSLVRTHWIRTGLVSASGLMLLAWAIIVR